MLCSPARALAPLQPGKAMDQLEPKGEEGRWGVPEQTEEGAVGSEDAEWGDGEGDEADTRCGK